MDALSTAFTVDTAPLIAIAATVIGGLAVVWVIKKSKSVTS